MKTKHAASDTITVQKVITSSILVVISLFIIIGTIATFQTSFTSASLKRATHDFTADSLVYLLSMENAYFSQALPTTSAQPSLEKMAFEMITSLDIDDPRTFLGRELPGFSHLDGRIVVAGEGSDFTNIPIESAPPLEVIMAEREAAAEKVAATKNEEETNPQSGLPSTGKNIVHIIHSHNRESFLPELKNVSDPDDAWHADTNITLVGERLGQELEERGLGAEVDKTDITSILNQNGWSYPQSYEASRNIVKTAMKNNKDLEYFLEIHRDSQRRDITTVTINGTSYARLYFVIGSNNPNYEKNLQIAEELHRLLEKSYPGLSRGVLIKDGTGINGRYNQDLSENSLLVEMGGVDNTLEETFRTSEALADVFSNYYFSTTEKENK